MMDRKRFGALLLCIGLILVLSVSTAFIAHEADHDCCGEDCPICRTVAINISLLRTLGLAVLAALFLFFLLSVRPVRCRRERYARFLSGTLVSWKIRLND
jgi:hypothetical protein